MRLLLFKTPGPCLAFTAALLAVILFGAGATHSQSATGRILGSVHDQQDSAIAGARVTVTDTLRNISHTTVTDDAGDYMVPICRPAPTKSLVEAQGFNGFQAPGIPVEVGKDIRVDVTLKAGDSKIIVTITEDDSLLDSTTSSLGGTLSNKEINDLPLNGRNYENLLQLRPGVVRYPGGGFSTTSSNGLRAEDNAYLIDGLFNSEPFSGQSIINGAGIAGDSATILPDRRNPGIQCNPKSSRGIWMEARDDGQRRAEIGHQRTARHCLWICPHNFARRTKLLRSRRNREISSQFEAVWGHRRRRDHQG